MTLILRIVCLVIVLLWYSDISFAYGPRTPYEDADAWVDHSWYFYNITNVVIAYPIFLFACFVKAFNIRERKNYSFLKGCAINAGQAILPFLFLMYVVGYFLLLGTAIIASGMAYYIGVESYLSSLEELDATMTFIYWIWYVFSLSVVIYWLPRTAKERFMGT